MEYIEVYTNSITSEKINMKLGTVLPTAKSLAMSDRYKKAIDKASMNKAKKSGFGNYRKTIVGGEIRYWKSETEYAIVSMNQNILWFEVREDGEYSVR